MDHGGRNEKDIFYYATSPNTAYTLRANALTLRGHYFLRSQPRICWERYAKSASERQLSKQIEG